MKLLTEKDDLSINDQSTIYSKKMRRNGQTSLSGVGGLKFTKQALMPTVGKYHKNGSLDKFLSSKYDLYTREYTNFFLYKLINFEENLEEHRREIQLNILSEKRTGGNNSNVVSLATETDTSKKTSEQQKEAEEKQKIALE